MSNYLIYSDGGSRGNPGPGGYGFVVKHCNKITKRSGFIGICTNNQAEYTGVLKALEYLVNKFSATEKKEGIEIKFFLDSQLIVEQMNGRYKIKNEGLKPLFWQIRGLIMDLGGKVTFSHVPREQNSLADELVNEAIDSQTLNPKS
ncbi:MAG: ribonuclease HI family protein [Patescibacteria group bacterium]|nr:ribonuclease HI family protein [Patescibacteria group bacterium]